MQRLVRPLLALGLGAAWIAGCSSDDYGPVGGRMPLDVSQDSLQVSLEPPLGALEGTDFEPPLDQAFVDREVLYLGNRDEGSWRATPLMQFDFSTALPDTFDPGTVKSVRLQLEMLTADANRGIQRTVEVYELADTLRTTDLESPAVGALLGTVVADTTRFGSSTFDVLLPLDLVLGWSEAGAHRGIALYDLTPSDSGGGSSNFVGFAGKEFKRFGSELAPNDVAETAVPEILIETDEDGVQTFFRFPVKLDFTFVEHAPADPDDLTLGAYLPSRIWLRFDLENSGVPGNATVNEAILTLVERAETSLGERAKILSAYEATRSQALTGKLGDFDRVLRSAGSFSVATDSLLRIDVTDFVQRAVNLVVEPDVGLLLSFDDSLFKLDVADFRGLAAPDSLRPRLEINFTPPADFWR